MEGGELFQRIQERADGGFTERGMAHILQTFNCKLLLTFMFHRGC